MFGVILIGLGIDFGVHYAARYLQLREKFRQSGDALVRTAQGVGPGILTGADRDLAVTAFHLGAIGVLQKPLDMATLDAALRRCLQCVGLFADGTGGPELSAVMQLHHAIASGTAALRPGNSLRAPPWAASM